MSRYKPAVMSALQTASTDVSANTTYAQATPTGKPAKDLLRQVTLVSLIQIRTFVHDPLLCQSLRKAHTQFHWLPTLVTSKQLFSRAPGTISQTVRTWPTAIIVQCSLSIFRYLQGHCCQRQVFAVEFSWREQELNKCYSHSQAIWDEPGNPDGHIMVSDNNFTATWGLSVMK